MTYKINTGIATLKKVFAILVESDLTFLLSGEQPDKVDFQKVITKLFLEDKLIELLIAITGDKDADFDNMEIDDAVELVVSFFVDIGKKFGKSIAKIADIGKEQVKP